MLRLSQLTRLLAFALPLVHAGPSLDVNDISALKDAAASALKNLMGFYLPNPSGVFEQAQTPWHETGMIWGMYMDYAKYTGDTHFLDIVTGALVNTSYGAEQYAPPLLLLLPHQLTFSLCTEIFSVGQCPQPPLPS